MQDSPTLLTAYDLQQLGYSREAIRAAFNSTDKLTQLTVLGWDHKLPLFGRKQAARVLSTHHPR
jgi:hypothetical protein